MKEPERPGGYVVARMLHAGLAAGLVVFTAACYAFRAGRPPVDTPAFLGWVPLLIGSGIFTGAALLKDRFMGGDGTGDWWKVNLPRALLLWSLFEGPALFGAAIYLGTGAPQSLAATAVGFALLLWYSPDRLHDG